jgi:hypothetical protein
MCGCLCLANATRCRSREGWRIDAMPRGRHRGRQDLVPLQQDGAAQSPSLIRRLRAPEAVHQVWTNSAAPHTTPARQPQDRDGQKERPHNRTGATTSFPDPAVPASDTPCASSVDLFPKPISLPPSSTLLFTAGALPLPLSSPTISCTPSDWQPVLLPAPKSALQPGRCTTFAHYELYSSLLDVASASSPLTRRDSDKHAQ